MRLPRRTRHGAPGRTPVRTRGRHLAAALLPAALLAFTPQPVRAAETASLTAPYAGSRAEQSCDRGALCTTTVTADVSTGGLLVDLSVLGAEMLQPRYCPADWLVDPRCPPVPTIGPTGGRALAMVEARYALDVPLTSVIFTVTIATDQAAAHSVGGTADAYLWTSATPSDGRVCAGGGGTSESVVASGTAPTAAPTSRTLTFTYSNWCGGNVPAGPLAVYVGVTAEASGPGSGQVRAGATVLSIVAQPNR